MKRVFLLNIVVLLFFPINELIAKEYTLGVGLGSLYNGLGVNGGVISNGNLTYVSIGCPGLSYSSQSDSQEGENNSSKQYNNEFRTNCGIGLGYIKTGLFPKNGKHGVGLSFGYSENKTTDKRDNGKRSEYYIGAPYHYFFRENTLRGWNLGVTPLLRFIDSKSVAGLMLNLGFQF